MNLEFTLRSSQCMHLRAVNSGSRMFGCHRFGYTYLSDFPWIPGPASTRITRTRYTMGRSASFRYHPVFYISRLKRIDPFIWIQRGSSALWKTLRPAFSTPEELLIEIRISSKCKVKSSLTSFAHYHKSRERVSYRSS
jgi:hypothetical protein